MKNLILSCLVVCALVSVVGCSSSTPPAPAAQSAPMATDTKNMQPPANK